MARLRIVRCVLVIVALVGFGVGTTSGPAGAGGQDTFQPTCFVSALIAGPPKQMQVTVQDTGSGLAAITNVQVVNGTVGTSPSPIPVGTTAQVVVTATKIDQNQPTVWSFDAVDVENNIKHCA